MWSPAPSTRRALLVLCVTSLAAVSLACSPADAAESRRKLREDHVPAALQWIREDIAKVTRGTRAAAARFAPLFQIEDAENRERRLRQALNNARNPPRAMPEFSPSPVTFLVGLDGEGVVIARDVEPDHLKGEPFAERFSVVREAMQQRRTTRGNGAFESADGTSRNLTVLMTSPVVEGGETIGAITAGVSLWRLAERVTRQLRADHAAEIQSGGALWAYFYEGDHLHHRRTPPDLDVLVPDRATREAALANRPNGYTGVVQLFARPFGYCVVPIPSLGEDIGLIVFRAEPQ